MKILSKIPKQLLTKSLVVFLLTSLAVTACTSPSDDAQQQQEAPLSFKSNESDTNTAKTEKTNNLPSSPMIAEESAIGDLGAVIIGEFIGDIDCDHANCDSHRIRLKLQADGNVVKTINDIYHEEETKHISVFGQYTQEKDIISISYNDGSKEFYLLEGTQLIQLDEVSRKVVDGQTHVVLSQK